MEFICPGRRPERGRQWKSMVSDGMPLFEHVFVWSYAVPPNMHASQFQPASFHLKCFASHACWCLWARPRHVSHWATKSCYSIMHRHWPPQPVITVTSSPAIAKRKCDGTAAGHDHGHHAFICDRFCRPGFRPLLHHHAACLAWARPGEPHGEPLHATAGMAWGKRREWASTGQHACEAGIEERRKEKQPSMWGTQAWHARPAPMRHDFYFIRGGMFTQAQETKNKVQKPKNKHKEINEK